MKGKSNSYNIPIVIEQTATGERAYDIRSRLLKERIVFLDSVIDSESANSVISQLLFLDYQDQKDISLYINSPGGDVYQTLAIYDTIRDISSSIVTVCIGEACSGAAVILSSGDRRLALPNSRIMIHQPWGAITGQVTDLGIEYKQMMEDKECLTKILSENCNQPIEKIKEDCERNFYMSAEEAVKYGIIDQVREGRKRSRKRQ